LSTINEIIEIKSLDFLQKENEVKREFYEYLHKVSQIEMPT